MFARLRRTIVVFAACLCAFLAYHVAAVPFIEPTFEDRGSANAGPIATETPRDRTGVLRPYFAPGSWALDNPIILESDQSKLLFKEYIVDKVDNKKVMLKPCAFVFFPSGDLTRDAPQRVIVLEAPQGALLQFDSPVDLQGMKLGQLQGGQMKEAVTIRGTPSRPGASDDIFVETRDVVMSPDTITTEAPVDFRFGPSTGHGRQLLIHLRRSSGATGTPRGPNIGGMDSLELLHDVQMRLIPGAGGIMPFDGQPRGTSAVAAQSGGPRSQTMSWPVGSVSSAATGPSQSPVDIRCQGPFKFDMAQYIATFQDKVNVIRQIAHGPRDWMNCERLSIFFAPKAATSTPPGSSAAVASGQPSPGPGSQRSKNLEPRRIEARGAPVIMQAESSGAFASAEHFVWSKDLKSPPNEQEQLISFDGHARVGSTRQGELAGDEIYLWLKELPPAGKPDGKSGPAGELASGTATPQSQVVAERMMAKGHIQINSPQLSGTTSLLQAWFGQAGPGDLGSRAAGAGGANAAQVASRPSAAAASGPTAANQPQRNLANAPLRHYSVAGERIRLQLLSGERGTEIEDITIDGRARFGESQAAQPGELPLLVTGEQIEVLRANALDTTVAVSGKPAEVGARGMVISGDIVRLDKKTNLVWIDGPGRMTLPMNQSVATNLWPGTSEPRDPMRQPGGQPAPAARPTAPADPLYVTWKDRMTFDGFTAHFEHSIVGESTARRFRTDSLDVSLRRRIDFSQPQMDERAEIEEILCRDGIWMESRSFDPLDPRKLVAIDRMLARNLTINETTGNILGEGPGELTSVRIDSPESTQPAAAHLTTTAQVTTPATSAGAGRTGQRQPSFGRSASHNANSGARGPLNYLNVRFAGPLSGNLNRHEITLHEHVRSIYGPVAAWEDHLNPDELGPDDWLMNCDLLTVRQMSANPSAADPQHHPIELEAEGNTDIEGDMFTAHAHRMTYTEAKDVLMLEGDVRSMAELYRQVRPGGETDYTPAHQILYWRSTGEVSINGAGPSNFNLGPAPPKAKKPATKNGATAAAGGAK
jgi:hypothetical protein